MNVTHVSTGIKGAWACLRPKYHFVCLHIGMSVMAANVDHSLLLSQLLVLQQLLTALVSAGAHSQSEIFAAYEGNIAVLLDSNFCPMS